MTGSGLPEEMVEAVGGPTLFAVAEIWATVDLDRAVAEFGGTLEALADDQLLGAKVGLVRRAVGWPVAVLEPTTEGRLAATLARVGEGPAGWYAFDPEGLDARAARARAVGRSIKGAPSGPFGAAVLVRDRPLSGPHLVLVEPPAGTIDPMIERETVTLRPATDADADRIAALFTDEGYPAGPSDIVQRLDAFDSPHSRVIVADYEGEVLGFIAVHSLPRFEHSDRILRIIALVVDAGVRDRGVGHLLMQEAERLGREQGVAFIEVTAGHHRADARHLYESLGYDASVAAYLRKRLQPN
jgi:ribosomal protein S18 acetylase RimI-like enzyme